MNIREAFESKNDAPPGCCWNPAISKYIQVYPEFVGDDEVEEEISRYNKDYKVWASAWTASRESQVVELDPPHNDYENYRDSEVTGACKYYEQAKKHIHSAGIRTK